MNLNYRDGDGYRTHANPDGSGCWLEGHPDSDALFVCPRGITRKLNNCLKRMGLDFSQNEWRTPTRYSTNPVRIKHNKLFKIWKLECELHLQERW